MGQCVGHFLGSRKSKTGETPTFDMTQAQKLIEALKHFRDARDWAQFHNPKDLALALSIEAAELNEQFLWRKPDDVDRGRVAEELADVFAYALLLLDTYDLDLEEIVRKKLEINEKNYPVEISRSNADKHH